jgi:hypothetical protein
MQYSANRPRTHVFRDLRPYLCTFDNCKEPEQQYDSVTDWITHEVSAHMVVDEQPNSLANVRDCPFCCSPKMGPMHIASHLRRIACFALPRSFNISEDSVFGSEVSRQARHLSRSSERTSADSVPWDTWAESITNEVAAEDSDIRRTEEEVPSLLHKCCNIILNSFVPGKRRPRIGSR